MDTKLEQVYAESDEASDRNTPQDEWRIRKILELAKRIRQLGRRFGEFTKHSDEPVSSIRQSVDNDLAWQAGRLLCEVFDHGLLEHPGFAVLHKSDVRRWSPMWCKTRLETLKSRQSIARRTGRPDPGPADPELIQLLQNVVDAYESSSDDELERIHQFVIRICWWSYIKKELSNCVTYKTRLGASLEAHWPFIDYITEPGIALSEVKPFAGDSSENRIRLRLQSSARVQKVACEILAELMESIAALESDELLRQVSDMTDADRGQSSKSATGTSDLSDETGAGPPDDPKEYSFTVDGEIVTIRGLGEKVSLEHTPGVKRLIRIVFSPDGKADALELARIGANQRSPISDSVNGHETGMSERDSPNGPLGHALGDDQPDVVNEKVGELIEDKKRAELRGDSDEAQRLTKKIDATLKPYKSDIQRAGKTVQNSLDRTYMRLKKYGGKKLAEHFDLNINRHSKSPNFVYATTEENEMSWIQK